VGWAGLAGAPGALAGLLDPVLSDLGGITAGAGDIGGAGGFAGLTPDAAAGFAGIAPDSFDLATSPGVFLGGAQSEPIAVGDAAAPGAFGSPDLTVGISPYSDIFVPQAGQSGFVDSGAFDVPGSGGGFFGNLAQGNVGQAFSSLFSGGEGAGSGGGGTFLSDLAAGNVGGALGDAASYLGKNPGLLISGAGLGYEMLNKASNPLSGTPGYNQISNTAGSLATQGQQLTSFLQNGTLPPGVQGALTQAAHSAKAAIRSQYAARGMSGSSAEAQDLAGVDQTIASQGVSIATQLLQTGISEQNLSAQLYSTIMSAQLNQDNQLSQAIAALAAAAARPTITLPSAGTTG